MCSPALSVDELKERTYSTTADGGAEAEAPFSDVMCPFDGENFVFDKTPRTDKRVAFPIGQRQMHVSTGASSVRYFSLCTVGRCC